ncbi:MAG: polysaccharide deacetylase family protein [bacterium]|nr:polysaccharide deacetylase family protein [bacterium]
MSSFVILIYHMISEPRAESERRYACPPSRFDQHMAYLRAKDFNLVGLNAINDYLKGGKEIPGKTVVITLDDGYADNYEKAFPILLQYRIPATIFLVSGVMGNHNAWMEGLGFPRRAMLTWRQVRKMAAAGIAFGGHTITHPCLPEVTVAEARREIEGCKKEIEDRLGQAADHFAYPYGLFGAEVQALTEEAGYTLACSGRSGFNNRQTDLYALRRLEVFGTDPVWKLSQKLKFGTNVAGALQPLKYYWNRARTRLWYR